MHKPVVATLNGSTVLTVPGLGPELWNDRLGGPDLLVVPHPRIPRSRPPTSKDSASVTVAHEIASIVVSDSG
jgi:hypothetical protein